VIEMLGCYWSEVHVVNTDKTIVAAAVKSSSPSSAMFLIQETSMVVYATCIPVSHIKPMTHVRETRVRTRARNVYVCHTDLQQDISRASFSHQIERVLFRASFSCEFLVRVSRTSFSCVCHRLKSFS